MYTLTGLLPPPMEDFEARVDPMAKAMLDRALACSIVGDADTVRDGLKAFLARTGADELMITAQIFDHAARVRSYEIAAGAHAALADVPA